MLYDAETGDFAIALTGDSMLTRRLSVFGEERFQALVNILWNSGDHQTFRRGRPRARRNWEEPGHLCCRLKVVSGIASGKPRTRI